MGSFLSTSVLARLQPRDGWSSVAGLFFLDLGIASFLFLQQTCLFTEAMAKSSSQLAILRELVGFKLIPRGLDALVTGRVLVWIEQVAEIRQRIDMGVRLVGV